MYAPWARSIIPAQSWNTALKSNVRGICLKTPPRFAKENSKKHYEAEDLVAIGEPCAVDMADRGALSFNLEVRLRILVLFFTRF